MKLVRNRKVEPLYRRKATVQYVLKDTLARNEYDKVLVVGVDREGYLHLAHSHMSRLEAIGMAEYAKAAILKRMQDDED